MWTDFRTPFCSINLVVYLYVNTINYLGKCRWCVQIVISGGETPPALFFFFFYWHCFVQVLWVIFCNQLVNFYQQYAEIFITIVCIYILICMNWQQNNIECSIPLPWYGSLFVCLFSFPWMWFCLPACYKL